MRTITRVRRRGALTVEAAFVYPVMFLLLLGLIAGGLGVWRYQQVACQAQESARWASVRGSDYQKDTGQSSPTTQDITNNVVLPLAAGMDPASITVRVQWLDMTTGQASDWDSASKAPTGTTGNGATVTNTVYVTAGNGATVTNTVRVTAGNGATVTNKVRVTVSYQWMPPVVFLGPLTLTCTAEAPMSY